MIDDPDLARGLYPFLYAPAAGTDSKTSAPPATTAQSWLLTVIGNSRFGSACSYTSG